MTDASAPASTPDAPTFVQRVRSVLRHVRRLPERLQHGERRDEALARLAAAPLPRAIQFICLGNICRSPYAEARFREFTAGTTLSAIPVASAGFLAAGRSMPSTGQTVAAQRGLVLAAHRSTQLDATLVRHFDLHVVMAPDQALALGRRFGIPRPRLLVLGDLDPLPIETREIRDPYEQDANVFVASFDRIDRCLRVLVDILARRG